MVYTITGYVCPDMRHFRHWYSVDARLRAQYGAATVRGRLNIQSKLHWLIEP
jgi:hypothetical protein